jgi:hypothetical protein
MASSETSRYTHLGMRMDIQLNKYPTVGQACRRTISILPRPFVRESGGTITHKLLQTTTAHSYVSST